MKAIRLAEIGTPDALRLHEMPIPEPRPGEVRVRNARVGVNFADINLRRSGYPAQIALPVTPGLEGAGVVDAIGDGVTDLRPGDRVAYLALGLGAYAEYVRVDAKHVVPLSDETSFDQGAALLLQGLTAHFLVFEQGPIAPGSTVVVHAAAGGMGLLLTQWLKHLGATVVGTVSTPSKAEAALAAGADHVVTYDDFVDEVRSITRGRGADYIIEGVGKPTFARSFDAVATRGRIAFYGWAGGAPDAFEPLALVAKSITLSGGNVGSYVRTRAEILGRARCLFDAVASGIVKARIDRTLPLSEAGEAHRALENRETIGKVLLDAGDPGPPRSDG